MKQLLHVLFWFAEKRNKAWRQLELFACDRKMKTALQMHNIWRRITGEDLPK